MESKQLAHKAKPLANYPHLKRVGDFFLFQGRVLDRKIIRSVARFPTGAEAGSLTLVNKLAG